MYTGAGQTIEVFLEGAAATPLPWTAEALSTSLGVTPANGTIDNVTPVVMLPANTGFLKSVILRNADNVSHTVTIQLNNGATQRKVIAFILDAGDVVTYDVHFGWSTFNQAGRLRTANL